MQVSQSLDYSKQKMSTSYYRMLKLIQTTGGQTVTVGQAYQQSQWEIPVNVVNLSKSVLEFVYTPPLLLLNYNWVHSLCVPQIQSISLKSRSGITLAEINNVNVFKHMTNMPETKLEDFLTYSNPSNYTGAQIALTGPVEGMFKSNTNTTQLPIATNANCRIDGYTTPAFYVGGGNAGNNPGYPTTIAEASPSLRYQVPLRYFSNCLLSDNRDLFFGETLMLSITWDTVGRSTWAGTSNLPGAAATATADATISNLSLYLCCNNDPLVKSALMEKVNKEGMSILTPYVYMNKQNFAGGTTQNVSLRFDRGMGSRLQKCIHSVFTGAESLSTSFNNSLIVPAGDTINQTVLSYNTSINNQKLQDFSVNTQVHADWLLLKDKFEGSVVQNARGHKASWIHYDDFRGDNFKSYDDERNIELGLSLDEPVKWDFNGESMTNVGTNHYTFAVIQRNLVIKAGMIHFE